MTSALAVCASAAAIAQSQSHPQALAIPAFFSLDDLPDAGNPHSREDFRQLLDGGSVARIVVLDKSVLGTGSGVAGDCTGSPSALIDCLHANGSAVFGYVNTDFGCRPVPDVQDGTAENDAGVAAWSGLNVDGIFFDNVAVDSSDAGRAACFNLTHFRTVFSAVHANGWNGVGPDLCNGRACVMTNSSQYENDDILDGGTAAASADFSTDYERPVSGKQYSAICLDAGEPPDRQGYFGVTSDDSLGFCPNTGLDGGSHLCGSTMNPPGWYSADLAPRTAHVLREDPLVGPVHPVSEVLGQSETYHAGFVYLSDSLCNADNGAQYGHLTQFYEALVTSLGATLTIDRTGSSTGGGKVTSAGNGINCDESPTEKCSNLIPKGTTLRLTAQPDPDSSFAGFFSGAAQICNPNNDDPPPAACDHTLTADETIVVKFADTATGTLALTKSGPGTGTVTSTPAGISCGATCGTQSSAFAAGFVDLTATAASGSTFDHFAVSGAGNCANPCRVTVDANTTVSVTAFFDNTLTVTNDPIGGKGNVTSSDASIDCVSTCTFNCDVTCTANYTSAAMVTLTATATSGIFSRWAGACSGTSPTCQVSMATPQSVTAQFGATVQGGQCDAGQLPGCCPGDPCRPSGSSCLGVVCGDNQ